MIYPGAILRKGLEIITQLVIIITQNFFDHLKIKWLLLKCLLNDFYQKIAHKKLGKNFVFHALKVDKRDLIYFFRKIVKSISDPLKSLVSYFLVNKVLKNLVPFKRYFKISHFIFSAQKKKVLCYNHVCVEMIFLWVIMCYVCVNKYHRYENLNNFFSFNKLIGFYSTDLQNHF